MDREHNQYIGDVVNGLAKEAAFWKAKAMSLQETIAQMEREKPQAESKQPPGFYEEVG